MRISCGATGAWGATDFGGGNVFEKAVPAPTYSVWDVTSKAGGRVVTARVTFSTEVDATPQVDNNGVVADWWFENGTWVPYDTTNATVSQLYPGEGGYRAPASFQRWYLDVVDGTMHPEREMGREPWTQRLRAVANFDEPSLDELRDGWTIRSEESWPDPE